jgi:hypothetical protein
MDRAFTEGLFKKTIRAAERSQEGYVFYYDSPEAAQEELSVLDEPIVPGMKLFRNRYVDALIQYHQFLSSESDKSTFISFLAAKLTPTEGLQRESSIITVTLARTGQLKRLADRLGSWVDLSEHYLASLERIAEMLRFEPDFFSDIDLSAISNLATNINTGLDAIFRVERRRRRTWIEDSDIPLFSQVHEMAANLDHLAAEVPLFRYRQYLLGETNLEINHDYEELIESVKNLRLSDAVALHLQHIERTFRTSKDDFDYASCLRSCRAFQEDIVSEAVGLVSLKKMGEVAEKRRNFGQGVSFLEAQAIMTTPEKGLFNVLNGFLSQEGAHSAYADREQARIAKNILIELSWLLMKRLEAL